VLGVVKHGWVEPAREWVRRRSGFAHTRTVRIITDPTAAQVKKTAGKLEKEARNGKAKKPTEGEREREREKEIEKDHSAVMPRARRVGALTGFRSRHRPPAYA